MEAIAHAHQWSLTMYTHTGAVKRRWGRRFGESYHPMGLYQCGDGGGSSVGAASRDQWDNFCITTDTVELMADETLYAPADALRAGRRDRCARRPWLAAHTADEAVAAFQANRVPASRVLRLRRGAARPSSWRPAAFLFDRPDLGPGARGAGRAVPARRPAAAPAAPALGATPPRAGRRGRRRRRGRPPVDRRSASALLEFTRRLGRSARRRASSPTSASTSSRSSTRRAAAFATSGNYADARRGRGASWPRPWCGPRSSPTPIRASTRGTAWACSTR